MMSHGAQFTEQFVASALASAPKAARPASPALLAASYAACRRVARRSASSFYYSFFLLPRAQREAMCALYAFLRHTDDLGDNDAPVEERRAGLIAWRRALADCFAGDVPFMPASKSELLLPALADSARRFDIPRSLFDDAVTGVEMDLWRSNYATQVEAEDYCYHVASTVGIACIHIWGFRDPAALDPARRCGFAFQWTNILRDIKEDSARGRLYLPLESLSRFGLVPDDLAAGIADPRVKALMAAELARAEAWYADAERLGDYLSPSGRRIFRAMVATYRCLLEEIKRRQGDVWTSPIRLSAGRKLRVVARYLISDI